MIDINEDLKGLWRAEAVSRRDHPGLGQSPGFDTFARRIIILLDALKITEAQRNMNYNGAITEQELCGAAENARRELQVMLKAAAAKRDELRDVIIKHVIPALESLPPEALGDVPDDDDQQGWWIRDELIDKLANVVHLAQLQGGPE